jgi:hypothetical protein
MQPLVRTLQDHDLGHLRILAELWGLDLPHEPSKRAARSLATMMLDPSTVSEIIESLPPPIRQSLDFVLSQGGRAPLADLIRRFGPLRTMGAGRRDREKPWRDPASPLEALWYRGLLARAFVDTPTGPQEFIFIPTDLQALLPQPSQADRGPLGQSAEPPPIRRLATSIAVDDATTLLAALRRRPCDALPLPSAYRLRLTLFLRQPDTLDLLLTLLVQESILIAAPLTPDPQSTKTFLDAPREEALGQLLLAWRQSTSWNDLQHVPHLSVASGLWPNDPATSRRTVLELLSEVPLGVWWDLKSFVESIHLLQPAFQRPAGDFGSWYLRDARSGAFLRGFEHWDAIDGALLRYLITGPLHWLGAADIGESDQDKHASCFRLTSAAAVLFDPQAHFSIKASTASASIKPDGRIIVPRRAMRSLRYQIARFTAWDPLSEESYSYRLTPSTLQDAIDQGLELVHIRAILESAGEGQLPAGLVGALERWASHGEEARLDRELVLRVREPSVLEELSQNRETARYLGEILGPTSALVHQRDWSHLYQAAAKVGILIEPPASDTSESA